MAINFGRRSMRKLILTTVSVLALGVAGAGLGHAAETSAPQSGLQGVQTRSGERTQTAPQTGLEGVQAQTGGQMQAAHGAQAENWSQSRIEQVQRQLKAAGAYNGPIDGRLDTKTENAIAKFQEQHGLQKTGTLDQRTLAALNNQSNGTGSSQGR
jgi:peptidoglycan hydrolase-like protein with peptidoglycan-binding domain